MEGLVWVIVEAEDILERRMEGAQANLDKYK